MEYRLERARMARRVVPAVAVVALLVGGGLALLSSGSSDNVATFADGPATSDTAPALERIGETGTPVGSAPEIVAPSTAAPAPTTSAPQPAITEAPAPSTTIAAESLPTGSLPEQPTEPIAPPEDTRGAEDHVQLGGISIPSLGVDAPLLEGIRLTTLDNGPGHWPGTAMPGEVGNVVVAAHRTSHGGPFRHIDQLTAGDLVEFTTATGLATYVVTGTQIVQPDAIWIVDQTDMPTATLFACHPPGSVAQRIVVNLELAS